jgi:hypothetical protein
MARACRHCGAAMDRLVETCPSCGGFNRAERPLYVWLIGGALVLALILGLGDLGAVFRVAANVMRQLYPAR